MLVGLGGVLLGLVATFVALTQPFAARPLRSFYVGDGSGTEPAGWRVEDSRLKVSNGRDEQLWEYRFPFALDERPYVKDRSAPSLVAIADLEADGKKELLFIAHGKDPIDSALFCFNANGSVRFSAQPPYRVRFGDQEYAPPFEVQQIFLTAEADRRRTLWLVARHHAWFPNVLQKLTHTGDVVAEYWNDGRIDSLREARLGSRRVILVAGTNVEYAGPSLSVLDYDAPGGSAPGDDARFRCGSCAARYPLAAFVMPFTSMWSEMNLAARVDDMLLARDGYITLALHGAKMADDGGHTRLNVLVTVDQRFEVLDVQANDLPAGSSAVTKNAASSQTRLQMFPVLRWLDGRRTPAVHQIETP